MDFLPFAVFLFRFVYIFRIYQYRHAIYHNILVYVLVQYVILYDSIYLLYMLK